MRKMKSLILATLPQPKSAHLVWLRFCRRVRLFVCFSCNSIPNSVRFSIVFGYEFNLFPNFDFLWFWESTDEDYDDRSCIRIVQSADGQCQHLVFGFILLVRGENILVDVLGIFFHIRYHFVPADGIQPRRVDDFIGGGYFHACQNGHAVGPVRRHQDACSVSLEEIGIMV